MWRERHNYGVIRITTGSFLVLLVLLVSLLSFRANGNPVVTMPSTGDIDAAIATAEQQGRVVAIKTGGLSIPAAMSELASLPVTFRSEIDGWKYDITVMSMDFTATGSRLSVGCKFILPNSMSAIYFASDNISVSAKNGFKGEMYILPSTLSDAKNSELSSQALAQLNGKTVFYEFALPQFSNKLWMGLDETSKVNFSCGAFEKFQLSGFLKSYNEVEQEDATGQTLFAGKPYVLTFQGVEVNNWNDMYFSAIPVNGFHDFTYKDLGFHFPSNALVRVDLSNYQNPPNLPTCSATAGSFWKGIYFEQFAVRLPAIFLLKSGTILPMANGQNLFIDTNGLVGSMLAENVFGLSEGVARGLENSDMSLIKVTANYGCGGRINALMEGDIQLGTCDGSSEKTKVGYVFNYADNIGYTYSLTNSETRKALSSNVVQLSTGSTLTFGVSNGQFSVEARYPTIPVITTNVFKNRICKDYSADLSLNNCSNFVEWNTEEATMGISVSPTATSTYTAKCFDKYCISAEAAPLTIEVIDQLTNPEWNTIPAEFCSNESHKLATTTTCEGQIEWKTPENTNWTIINGGDGASEVETARPGITTQVNHTYQVRCRLNTCMSDEISKTLTLRPAPNTPTLAKTPTSEISCGIVRLLPSGCVGEYHWYRPDGNEATGLIGHTQWSRSDDGTDAYYVKCKNTSSGCYSNATATHYVKVEKCHCTPAPPTISSNQSDYRVCQGTTITFTATGCSGGTVNWYNNAGHHKGSGMTLQLSGGAWDRYSATCTNSDGCKSGTSNHLDLEFVDCPYDPPSLTNSNNYYLICLDASVTLTAGNCPGTIKWYRNSSAISHSGTTLILSKDSYGTDWSRYHTTCVNSQGTESGKSVYQDIEFKDCTEPSSKPIIGGYTAVDYCPGEQISFSSSCSNSASIEWFKNGTSTGVTNGSYNLTFEDACIITVKCSNSAGTVSSDQVVLTKKTNCGEDNGDGGDDPVCNPPTLTSTASSISSGGSSTLTASGCTGTVNWSTGASGASITVTPTVSTTYTATCTENGCTSTASSITVNVNCSTTPSSPTMSSDATICSGESITISATCATGSVKWTDDASASASRAGISPTITTTYKAVCQDANGCSSTESSVVITVNAKPNAPTVSCTNCTITSGSTTDIYMSGCSGTTILSDGQVFAGTAFNVNPTETTTYTATCTVNGCISNNSSAVTITVNASGCTPPSPPSISKIFKTLTAINCSGTITWSDGADGNVHVVNPSVSTIYTATCKVGGCTSENSNTVTVNPNECSTPDAPTISASSTTLSATGCAGTVTWSNGSTGTSITVSTTGNYSATCTVGNCTSGNSSEIYICIKPTLVNGVAGIEKTKNCGSVTLTGSCSDDATLKWGRKIRGTFVLFQSIGIGNNLTWTDINGLPDNLYVKCMLDENCESDEINIPNLSRSDFDEETNFETEPVNKTICSGASTTLSATCTKGLPHWNNDVISETNTVSPTSTTSYSVYCENGTCISNSKSVTVTVNSAPVATLTATDNNKLCTNSSVTLTASCTNNGEMNWFPDTKVVTTGGTYTVTCTKTGCNSSTASVSIVDERPDMTVFQHSLDQNKELTVNCTNTQNVKWYRDGELVGNQPVLFTNNISGTYHATCSNNCGTFTSESVNIN